LYFDSLIRNHLPPFLGGPVTNPTTKPWYASAGVWGALVTLVSSALALLKFSKKHAAVQIEKTLSSAVANAEHLAREANESVDVDALYVKHAIVNEGPKIKRFMPAAQGRATPIQKRTSHVHIVVGAKEGK
jgi:large subunit ribosomal protein L22